MVYHRWEVEEHSVQRTPKGCPSGRRRAVRHAGADRKEDVGISNDNPDEKSGHRKSKVS